MSDRGDPVRRRGGPGRTTSADEEAIVRYVVLLYGDDSQLAEPDNPDKQEQMAGYAAFAELAAGALVGGDALHSRATAHTIRHDGGQVTVTDGPFAESVEGLGGFYVLDAPTLDDAIELVRHIPIVHHGGGEIRPAVEWFDRSSELGAAPAGSARWLATIHGPETESDVPGSSGWDAGMESHGQFAAKAGDALVAGGAVQPTTTATTVRVRDGELLVTDGPYAESMEVVGGFYVVQGTADAAIELAGHVPVNDGGAVQLQQIMEFHG
jgi:hypothetical protein